MDTDMLMVTFRRRRQCTCGTPHYPIYSRCLWSLSRSNTFRLFAVERGQPPEPARGDKGPLVGRAGVGKVGGGVELPLWLRTGLRAGKMGHFG